MTLRICAIFILPNLVIGPALRAQSVFHDSHAPQVSFAAAEIGGLFQPAKKFVSLAPAYKCSSMFTARTRQCTSSATFHRSDGPGDRQAALDPREPPGRDGAARMVKAGGYFRTSRRPSLASHSREPLNAHGCTAACLQN